MKINTQLPLSHFSEPQAVWVLLTLMRFVTTALLLVVCAFAYWSNIKGIQSLIDWPILLAVSSVVLALCMMAVWLRHAEINFHHLSIIMLCDIACWSGLVAATGGSINPAISYLLVLLTIAGLALPWRNAFILLSLTALFYAWIMQIHPSGIPHRIMMGWHLWGMWFLFVINAILMLLVVALLSKALRQKDHAIAEFREETVRNEQLVTMGVMAANIAHEIGTPLSTITMLIDDMDCEEKPLLMSQLERCKSALHQLKHGHQYHRVEIVESAKVLSYWHHECLLLHPEATINIVDHFKQPLQITPLLEQAILTIMNNAIEAAHNQVILTVYPKDKLIVFDIEHDGEMIAEELLKKLGRQVVDSTKQGLGIGYYLANASIERLHGRMQLSNLKQGVLTRIELPVNNVNKDETK